MSSNNAADQIELLAISSRLGWPGTIRTLLDEVRKQAAEVKQAHLNGIANDLTHMAGNLEIAEYYAENIKHNASRKLAEMVAERTK